MGDREKGAPYEGKIPAQECLCVEIVRSDYQPSKAELEEDMSIDATFEDLMQVAVQPVEIRYIPRPKKKE